MDIVNARLHCCGESISSGPLPLGAGKLASYLLRVCFKVNLKDLNAQFHLPASKGRNLFYLNGCCLS